MKINKKLCLIFFFFLSFLFVVPVDAAKYDAETYSGSAVGCSLSWDYCWTSWGSAVPLQGVRVTAYYQDGTRVSNTVDFTNTKAYSDVPDILGRVNGSKYYMSSGQNSRIDYIKNKKTVNKVVGTPNIKWANFNDFIKLDGSESSFYFADESSVLDEIGYCDAKQGYICSVTGAYYFVIEPLTIIWSRNEDYNYYGTYYELINMLKGNNSGIFVGVASFVPSNLGLSLYINKDSSDFASFYKRVGLVLPKTNSTKELEYVKSCSFSGKCTDYSTLYSYTKGRLPKVGYGVGVMTISKQPNIEDDHPVKLEDCTVKKEVDACYDRIVYEYQNCPLNRSSIVEYESDYDNGSATICKIQCNEKYYVATWGVRDSFNPINETGILAGTYFSVNGPTVYHKKTCQYVPNISNLNSLINRDKNSCRKECPTDCEEGDSSCSDCRSDCAEYYNSVRDDYEEACADLNKKFKNMSAVKDAKKDAESQEKIDLKTDFSQYQLEPVLESTSIGVDGYDYGYKNTFVYQISGDVNRYISINDAYNKKSVGINNYFDYGRAMASTPINIKSGSTNYYVDYYDLFSDSFLQILTTADNKRIKKSEVKSDTDAVCPYNIIERNIEKPVPIQDKDSWENPDIGLKMPAIRLLYRPISLSVPFPGRNYIGIQREAGSNWTEEAIDTYITNNRGVVEDEVYNKDPIYVINLDSSTIKAIREYNKNNSYDDFTLSCTAGKGTECISNFLRNYERDYNLFIEDTACSKIKAPDSSGIPNLEFYTCLE